MKLYLNTVNIVYVYEHVEVHQHVHRCIQYLQYLNIISPIHKANQWLCNGILDCQNYIMK